MSNEPGVDRTVVVSDDDVRVEKSFAREEFPVPAIKFQLVSESDDPVHVRLIDRIPEDFPMEGVGFHPDYESDNWTAYKEHRVEYERTLEPGESTITVYGIRLEDSSDVAGFLSEPTLERPSVAGEAPEDRPGADVDDILGADRSQLVRDALQGNGRLANQEPATDTTADEPGVEPVPDPSADGDEEAADDVASDPDAEPAIEPAADAQSDPDIEADADSATDADDDLDAVADPATETDDEPDIEADADSDTEVDDEPDSPEPREVSSDLTSVVRAAESVTPVASDDAEAYVDIGAEAEEADTPPAAGTAPDADGGLAATLAAEIRAGEVSEADLETLRSELDTGLPRSADVRIRRLQSKFSDLDAYIDAMEEFLNDEGTGAELIERLDAEFEEVTAELEELQAGLDAAGDDREEIRGEINTLDGDLAATDERLDSVDETASAAAAGVDDVHDRADTIEDHLDDVESDLDDLVDDLDDVAAGIDDVAADLDDTDDYVSDLDDDLAEVREEVSAVDDAAADARESLSADIADLREEVSALTDELERIDDIEDELEGIQTFRDRVNSAFGPAGGSRGGGDDGSNDSTDDGSADSSDSDDNSDSDGENSDDEE